MSHDPEKNTTRPSAEGEAGSLGSQLERTWTWMIETMGSGYLRASGDGRIIRCNPRAASILGCDPLSIQGIPLGEIFTNPQEFEEIRRDLVLRGEVGARKIVLSCPNGQGQELVASFLGQVEGGELVSLDALFEDSNPSARALTGLLASRDSTTGLVNRRRFLELAEREWSRVRRYQGSVSFMIVGIDDLAGLVEELGGSAGEAALTALARLCEVKVREVDLVGRYGDEVLAVMLPDTSIENAGVVADRIVRGVSALTISANGQELGFTASVGLSAASGTRSLTNILRLAEDAYSEAVQAGGDQLQIRISFL